MTRVNLIPSVRLRERHRRARVRRWITVTAAYSLFLLLAALVAQVARAGDDRSLHEELTEARSVVTASTQTIEFLEKDLMAAAAALTANRTVGDQPDWSVLLALLGETTGGDVVLRECRMTSSTDGRRRGARGSGDANAPPETIESETAVELGGLASAQRDVSGLLLRIEDIDIFRDVRLHDTHREPFLGGHAIAFRLDFTIDPTPDEQP